MGTGAFEAGPAAQLPETIPDAAFAVANVVPDTNCATKDYSPVFRYPYATSAAAVAAAPPARDGSRREGFRNPLVGGEGLAPLGCVLGPVDLGAAALPVRNTVSSGFFVGGGFCEQQHRSRHHPTQ